MGNTAGLRHFYTSFTLIDLEALPIISYSQKQNLGSKITWLCAKLHLEYQRKEIDATSSILKSKIKGFVPSSPRLFTSTWQI